MEKVDLSSVLVIMELCQVEVKVFIIYQHHCEQVTDNEQVDLSYLVFYRGAVQRIMDVSEDRILVW